MSESRRAFLKAAGLTALGGAGVGLTGCRLALAEEHDIEEAAASANRLAMVIDLRRCGEQSSCRRCMDECHRMHNVPNFVDNASLERVENDPQGLYRNNPNHEIKWIWQTPMAHAFPDQYGGDHGHAPTFLPEQFQHLSVPVLCNHCDDPPCVRVCPTQATWRREEDGIVMMDMHRCIGCRFCILGCPYGSRSFNLRDPRMAFRDDPTDSSSRVRLPNPRFPTRMRGVVEKCNFCAELTGTDDRTPYCVRSCEAGALAFGDLSDTGSEVRRLLGDNSRFVLRRKPALGTNPHVFYLV